MKIKIKRDAKRVFDLIKYSPQVYLFGNGGSCAIANHFESDWVKCSNGKLQVKSLCSNPSVLTMIANDYGYQYVCSQQLEWLATDRLSEVVILISSSGNSKNILKALEAAHKVPMYVIGFTGFKGGKLKERSDLSIHINSKDYEQAENYHNEVMHQVSRLLKEDK